jgi:predicted ATPase/class 3 adenylate cyclase/tetratricopeptide (TPR) repeat protein
MADLATGTVTFLFTDIEGSTRHWEEHPQEMRRALARHDATLRGVIERHGGRVFKTMGDAFYAAFPAAHAAVEAALAAQQSLLSRGPTGPSGLPLRVRIALHTGEAELQDGNYFGATVTRGSRLLAAAHGEQVVLSGATQELLQDRLPEGASLKSLGPHRLGDLQRPEHVYQLLHPALPASFPPLRTASTVPHNLPQHVTTFVGREREAAEVRELLGTHRLVTITGVGGTGKTRLALRVAEELLEGQPDGAWLVELGALTERALVVAAVARALEVAEEPAKPLLQTLVERLKPKRLLLVLDNCEHLLDVCAELADTLVRGCPEVRVLATSREALKVRGERVFPLPSLSLPGIAAPVAAGDVMRSEAVSLFVDRAGAASPAFHLTDQNATAVVQICQRLDGIPLAIELAAARVRALPVQKIAERLDDRFRLLTHGSPSALPRQQTLRALIDWSYDLLSEQARMLLRRLSVFSGGCALDAVEAVCVGEGLDTVEVPDVLSSLIDKSLVLCEQEGGQARYRMLGTVRQYARERLVLEEAAVVQDRHLEFFLGLAERAEPEVRGPDPVTWLDLLSSEHDNMRAALDWSRSGVQQSAGGGPQSPMGDQQSGGDNGLSHPSPLTPHHSLLTPQQRREAGLRIARALWRFWSIRGHYAEGRERLRQALAAAPDAPGALRSRALNAAGLMASQQGDYGEARRLFQESLEIGQAVGDPRLMSPPVGNLGTIAQDEGDYVAARSFYEKSLAIDRMTGERRPISNSLTLLGNLFYAQHAYTEARACYEESLALRRELGDRWGIAGSLNSLGNVLAGQGDAAAARSHFEESLALYRQLGDSRGACSPLVGLAGVARREGRLADSRRHYEESLETAREQGLKPVIVNCLAGIAALVAAENPRRSARLAGAVRGLQEAVGAALAPLDEEGFAGAVESARSKLGAEVFEAEYRQGLRFAAEEAVAFALETPEQ